MRLIKYTVYPLDSPSLKSRVKSGLQGGQSTSSLVDIPLISIIAFKNSVNILKLGAGVLCVKGMFSSNNDNSLTGYTLNSKICTEIWNPIFDKYLWGDIKSKFISYSPKYTLHLLCKKIQVECEKVVLIGVMCVQKLLYSNVQSPVVQTVLQILAKKNLEKKSFDKKEEINVE